MQEHDHILDEGWRLHQAGHLEDAQRLYRQVLDAAPLNADAWVYLGIALFDGREFDESVDAYRKAIKQRSHFPVAWNNLGNSLRLLGRLDEAEECFATALKQQPDYLSALKNRGTLWVWSGEIERGLRWYQQGLRVDPDDAELHRNIGVIHLLLGNYDVGWPEYRWRWRMPGLNRCKTSAPVWRGESLQGKTILLYPEQGLGDAIHFVRVAGTLRDHGATVILQCAPSLIPLFSSTVDSLHVDRLLVEDVSPPHIDYHASLIEVIDVLYQQTGTIAWGADRFKPGRGYLTVSDELIEYWRCWLDQHSAGRRIGINWQGHPGHPADIYRSIPLHVLGPLSQIGDVELISLQFGYGSDQLDHCDFAESILRLPDHIDSGGAFTDTAAILQNLDTVVTTDTAVAHLAGAVGADVTLILARVPDWRWLTEGETTPWYPSMRLARQTKIGNWDDVVTEIVNRIGQ